jgi:hypothetical protein
MRRATNSLPCRRWGRALLQGASQQPQALRLETSSGNLDLCDFPKSFAPVPWPKTDQVGTFYRRQRFGLQVAGRYLKSRYAPHAEVFRAAIGPGLSGCALVCQRAAAQWRPGLPGWLFVGALALPRAAVARARERPSERQS